MCTFVSCTSCTSHFNFREPVNSNANPFWTYPMPCIERSRPAQKRHLPNIISSAHHHPSSTPSGSVWPPFNPGFNVSPTSVQLDQPQCNLQSQIRFCWHRAIILPPKGHLIKPSTRPRKFPHYSRTVLSGPSSSTTMNDSSSSSCRTGQASGPRHTLTK
jgi:hypothetical protein